MTKITLVLTLWLLISSMSYSASGEPDLDYILEKVKTQQSRLQEEVKDSIFLTESIYKEKEKDGKIKKEVVAKRRTYMKSSDKRYEEYLFMSINGKELSKEEMEKELEDQKKREKDRKEAKMPLTPEGEGAYNFHLIGSGIWNNTDVWIIGFKAKQKEEGYVNGKGHVSKDTFDIVHVEMTPAKSSRVIKDMKIALTYSQVQGYWMPAKFEMDIKIKLSFLYYKHISVEETYSEYRLNNQLDDSLFESKWKVAVRD